MTSAEQHELECLRAQVKQPQYPCSPHCAGYLRELALRSALQGLVDALAVNDEDGLTEFADVMCAARAALSK